MNERRGLVLGLSGKFGSGKDTAADMIEQAFPDMQWKRISFALPIKEMVARMTRTTMGQNKSEAGKQIIPRGFDHSLGTLQQRVGMALREHIDPNIWVKVAFVDVQPDDNILITDVRFPNELAAIRGEWQGKVIRLDGRDPRPGEKRDPLHISETALDNHVDEFDFIIHNNGSLDDLRAQLIAYVNIHRRK